MPNKPVVYSYTRFSDPKQSDGTSAKRQIEYAEKIAARVNLPLDETLTLKDEGLSAYHSQHIKKGALGTFLKAVEDGKVVEGSYLVIEAMDRLTRAKATKAVSLLTEIIEAGITVITSADGIEYSQKSIDENPMQLMYSLMLMIRAHEESQTKSRRGKDAIKLKCKEWKSIEESGFISFGKDPGWVRRNADGFDLIPERVSAVRRIVELYKDGIGGSKIVDILKREGLSPSDKYPQSERVYRIVKTPMLIGTKIVNVDSSEFALKRYYPPILTEDEYYVLRNAQSKRVSSKAQNEIVGLFTGIGIAFCGYCGKAMNGQNYVSRMREDGTLADGHRRLICSSHNLDRNCSVGSSSSIVPVEKALLEFCTDKLQLEDLLTATDDSVSLKSRRDKLLAEQSKKKIKIDNIVEAVEIGGGEVKFLMQKLTKLESEYEELEKKIDDLTSQIRYHSKLSNPKLSEKWIEVRKQIDAFDEQARSSVAQLFAQTFKRIEIYVKGFTAGSVDSIQGQLAKNIFSKLIGVEEEKNKIGVRLISKNGTSRLLLIDKRDYTWLKIIDVDFEKAYLSPTK